MQHWFCLPVGCWFIYCLARAHTHSIYCKVSPWFWWKDAATALILSNSSNVLKKYRSRHGNSGPMHEDCVKLRRFHKLPQQEGNTSVTQLENRSTGRGL